MAKSSEQLLAAEEFRVRERTIANCKRELNALHEHHPEQWRKNLIELQKVRLARSSGVEINATSRSYARNLESRNIEIRSTGDQMAG